MELKMTYKLKQRLCRGCGIQLVEKDENGKLQFGKHLKGCPAASVPKFEGPARKAARSRLICGDMCAAPNSDLVDLGNGLVHCARCPAAELAQEANATYMKGQGKRGNVEIIHPSPRKTVEHWKRLYLDLLHKHAMALEELEQLKQNRR